jgi:hypothetical protein
MPCSLHRSLSDEVAVCVPARGLEVRVRLPLAASGARRSRVVATTATSNAPGLWLPLHLDQGAEILLSVAGHDVFRNCGQPAPCGITQPVCQGGG